MPKNLCIYHENCVDGVGAAFAVWYHQEKLGKEFEFIPASYGKTWKEVIGYYYDMVITDTFDHQNYECWIVDFSFPKDQLLEMADVFDAVIVLDHHKTAQEDCEGLVNTGKVPPNLDIVFDMARSGAGIAWDYCTNTEKQRPQLINLIEDRDIWKWEFGVNSKALHFIMEDYKKSSPLTQKDFNSIAPLLNGHNLGEVLAQGFAVLDYSAARIAEVARTAVKSRWIHEAGWWDVTFVECPYFMASDMGEYLKDNCDVVCLWSIDLERYTIRISLRSRETDVSAIAKQHFNGGGHRLAAGGWMEFEEFFDAWAPRVN